MYVVTNQKFKINKEFIIFKINCWISSWLDLFDNIIFIISFTGYYPGFGFKHRKMLLKNKIKRDKGVK
jgi:hypothetical protein